MDRKRNLGMIAVTVALALGAGQYLQSGTAQSAASMTPIPKADPPPPLRLAAGTPLAAHDAPQPAIPEPEVIPVVAKADPDVFRVYERLLRNKKDRVVVPIENRCCSGCHIMLTAQDENLVRKGERLVFCEHCSRIHYWQESEALEGSAVATKQRRRRTTKV